MEATRTSGGQSSWRSRAALGRSGPARPRLRAVTAMAITLTSAGAVVALGAGAAAWAAPARLALSCTPGSGAHLAGRTLTDAQILNYRSDGLKCADLTGANLDGLSLIQVDLTGAILRNAHLDHTDLGQATLTGADLSGADLSHAKLGQATLTGANLSGAILRYADLTQATANDADFRHADLTSATLIQTDLTKSKLDYAKLGSADFTQATLDQTTFTGATGLTSASSFSLYLLLGAGLVLVLLALGTVTRAVRTAARGSFQPVRTVIALLGCVLAALGLYLLAGGILGEALSAAGPQIQQACSGLACKISGGGGSGLIGIFGGVIVFLIGLAMRAMLRPYRNPLVSQGFGPPSGGTMGVPEWKSF